MMTRLTWAPATDRPYESGVDHGVLYLADGTTIPWNGLTSVTEQPSTTVKSYYIDGVKYLQESIVDVFSAKLTAYTYPVEFENAYGFSLSYRTQMGNEDRLHILYNLVAIPDNTNYESISNETTPIDFSWTLEGSPEFTQGHRSTTYVYLDTSKFDSMLLAALEEMLYGDVDSPPNLPSLSELITFFANWNHVTIIDNGDGTWTATSPYDGVIIMTNPTTFEIVGADTTSIDANTYTITTTEEA